MSSLVISGDTSGTVTVAAPAVAGSNTLTLLAATATNSVNTLATAVASTSGTSIDFTGIPSWVKRITVMFGATSTNNASSKLIRLIYGGTTVVSTGYRSSSARINAATAAEASDTTGFLLYSQSAADDMYGSYVLTNLSGNIWVGTGAVTTATGGLYSSGGVTISGTLTGIRITSVTPDTFDAGTINILYEG